jgi:hypothetical protein
MQATLLNFGDNTRVVCDSGNKPIAISIGEVIDCDIHDAHFHMIKRAVKTDTLMVVPKETRISEKLQGIIDVLKMASVEPYEVLLQRFNEVVPYDEERSLRPTRGAMLAALRDIASYEVAKALHMTSKVVIREEGDEVTRQPVQAPAPAPASPPPAKPPAKKAQKPVVKTRKRERL